MTAVCFLVQHALGHWHVNTISRITCIACTTSKGPGEWSSTSYSVKIKVVCGKSLSIV